MCSTSRKQAQGDSILELFHVQDNVFNKSPSDSLPITKYLSNVFPLLYLPARAERLNGLHSFRFHQTNLYSLGHKNSNY